MKTATRKQRTTVGHAETRALKAVAAFKAEKRYSPTYSELGKILNRAKRTAWVAVESLVLRGYMTVDDGKPRTMEITELGKQYLRRLNRKGQTK